MALLFLWLPVCGAQDLTSSGQPRQVIVVPAICNPVVGRLVENVARHLHVCIPLPVVIVGCGFLRSPVVAPPVGHPPSLALPLGPNSASLTSLMTLAQSSLTP